MHFQKITIVGVGLLGGSLGLAIKRRKLARNVTGFVRRAAAVAECEKGGAVDVATRDLREAVSGAELIILCTPLLQMRSLVRRMVPMLKPGAILTDVGSVKGSVVREIEPAVHKAGASFVGSHPMAGSEKAGVSAARADLFVNAVCVVTPTKRTDPAALRKVERFWKAVGCRLLRMTPGLHDTLAGRSSHLPQVAAVTLANLVLDPRNPRHQAALCATGFRDATRIASGSPEMWRDIALANRRNLAQALGAFIGDLQKFRRALNKADAKAIAGILKRAKQRRDAWSACSASRSPE
ncbi:MAG: prephenate dehydrogenase/arogenate dehydrogenase family protein [Verrucomicrobiota bacterium]